MIPIFEINKVAEQSKVPVDTVEKDYVISWLLLCIARSRLAEDFIFHGGTAIKRIFKQKYGFNLDRTLIIPHLFKK